MKVECVKDKLKKAVDSTARSTAKNLPLAVLQTITIEATKQSIVISATNLELGVEVTVPAAASKVGKVAIVPALLSGFLANVPDEYSVTLETVGENLSVSAGGNTVLIKAQSHDDFPGIPKMDSGDKETWSVSLDSSVLLDGLSSVWFAAAQSEIKPEIATVSLSTTDGELIFAATDTFRLAEKKISIDDSAAKNLADWPSLLLPIKNVAEMVRILDEDSEQVEILCTTSQLALRFNGTYVTSRLTEGTFPAYEAIIPKGYSTQVVIEKKELVAAIRLASVFSGKFQQLLVKVDPAEKLFELSSRSQEAGESNSNLDGTFEGESVDITLNGKYFLDALNILERDQVSVGFNGPQKAVTIRSVGDRSFLCLVMPLNR